jgi:hypothetical protein
MPTEVLRGTCWRRMLRHYKEETRPSMPTCGARKDGRPQKGGATRGSARIEHRRGVLE